MYNKRQNPKFKQKIIYVRKDENDDALNQDPIPVDISSERNKKASKPPKENKPRKKSPIEESKGESIEAFWKQPKEEKKEFTKEVEIYRKNEEESLTTLLIQQFKRKKVECPICYNKIANESRIWNCRQCFQPFHLSCISKWTQNSNLKKEKNQNILTWSCPKCCYLYTEKNPEYFCFCGKYSNPEYDPFILPHSCGEICYKKRGSQCTHLCKITCHPGPCPPCKMVEKKVICFCGKNQYLTECGDETNNFECNQICGKTLSCGKHYCQKKCHKLACDTCPLFIESPCFCGKETRTLPCGKELFSCAQPCLRLLDCQNHKCSLICHPNPCPECELKPEKVKTCPCGKNQLTTLMGPDARKSCLDSVAVCGLPCGKLLPCGKHYCNSMCHVKKECAPCKEAAEQECRCGKKKRKIECWHTYQKDPEIYLCEKVCKKKKSCGIHSCGTTCCPKEDVAGNHLCLKVCGKKLNCGTHFCDLFCHLGNCKPCPILNPLPITCVCTKTALQPPLPCGTKRPSCHQPCNRVRDCGHPCPLECHEDPCPPCDFKVDKLCTCGRFMMNLVSCSKEVSCGEPCDNILACGHMCGGLCHSGECPKIEEDGCGKKCGKIRKDCGHKCLSLCHPKEDECPKVYCHVTTKIKCICGTRFGFVECGLAKKKMIKCDNGCKNKQRFGGFSESDSYRKYSALLIRYARYNLAFLQRLEQRIDQMVKNQETSFEIPLFNSDNFKVFAIETLLVTHYQMDLEFYLHVPSPYMVVISTPNMRIPRLKLSENLKEIEKGLINNDVLPFETSFKFYLANKSSFFEEIEDYLEEEKINCVCERKGDKIFIVHFWESSEAEFAGKKLKKRNISNYQLELNMKMKSEDVKFLNYKADIVDIMPSASEEEKKE